MARLSRNGLFLFWTAVIILLIVLTYAVTYRYHIGAEVQDLAYTIEGVMLAEIFLTRIVFEEKPWVDITVQEDGDNLGFKLVARKKGLHHPRVTLDGVEWEFFKLGSVLNTPVDFMYVDVPYVFYPFKVSRSRGSEGWTRIEVRETKTENNVYTGEIHSTNGRADRIVSVTWVMPVSFNSEEAEKETIFMGGLQPQIKGDPLDAPLVFREDNATWRQRLFGTRKVRAQGVNASDVQRLNREDELDARL